MISLKEILKPEIDAGLINWYKLEAMVHAGLQTISEYNSKPRSGFGTKIAKLDSHISFPVKKDGVAYAYKILYPSFNNKQIVCSGLLIGTYLNGSPFFPDEPRVK